MVLPPRSADEPRHRLRNDNLGDMDLHIKAVQNYLAPASAPDGLWIAARMCVPDLGFTLYVFAILFVLRPF
ncbi:hypothetical protein MSAN_02358300 [Mycena sanguinolenta]|uniref:Uncharacterized protein n=1 Tax=Mycena sanguinolenta TaxID=230812 RepID=A0A8H7CGB3_9AGAR|nr:hypothetical protein MSAN_02358300 [Mycena sanguinolenta]